MLIALHHNIKIYNGPITQELLYEVYINSSLFVIRCENGKFEYLTAHKWRTAKEGGNWDLNSDWKEMWHTIPETANPLF